MDIPVLIEPVAGNGYRAVGVGLAPLTAEGATAEEALHRLRELLASRLAAGARLEDSFVGALDVVCGRSLRLSA